MGSSSRRVEQARASAVSISTANNKRIEAGINRQSTVRGSALAPVVAASVGGLNDLVLHGKTGYLVNERDPKLYAHYAHQILENPLHAAEIAMSAVEKAQQYSWQKTSDQILNLYASVSSRALVDCR